MNFARNRCEKVLSQRHWFCLLIAILVSQTAWGRDIQVDPVSGRDTNDGISAAVKTIARGLALATPGDTVHLKPAIYFETASFQNRHGEPGKPIVLDGHGATLDGSAPLDPTTWTEVAPGRFRNEKLLPSLNTSRLGRWFFLWNGKMNHMGRTSKGSKAPFKSPEELQPGEWTYIEDKTVDPAQNGRLTGAFYVQLQPGQQLKDANIALPLRMNGVQLATSNSHLVIRNITSTHVNNDGFNIHGDCHDVFFENIRAIECGDDGISAHETARYQVDGFVSIGNSTGICDIGFSQTSYNNVLIRDCLAYDLYFLDQGIYSVRNAVIHSTAERPLTVTGRTENPNPSRLKLENVLIDRKRAGHGAIIAANAFLKAERCTFLNMGFAVNGGNVALQESIIAGTPTPEIIVQQQGSWSGERNIFDISRLQFKEGSWPVDPSGVGFKSFPQLSNLK